MFLRYISFRVKIFIIIFLAIIVPVVFVSAILNRRAEQAITDQTSKVVINSINFTVSNIDSSLDSVTGISKLLLSDGRLSSIAENRMPFTQKEKTENYAYIRGILNYFISRIKIQNILSGIDSYYIYLPNQNTVIDSKSTYYENVDLNNVDFLQKLKQKEYDDSWFVSRPVNFFTLNNIKTLLEPDKLITINTVLKDDHGNVIAVLAANVKETFLSEYYSKIQKGINGDFIVIDYSGHIVAHDESEIDTNSNDYVDLFNKFRTLTSQSGNFLSNIDNQEQFVVYSGSGYTKWRYMVIMPATDVLGKVYEIKKFVYIIISIMVLLIIGITLLLSRIFYQPLDKLVTAMKKIKNRNLDVRIDDKRRDEYQNVFTGFNEMVIELKSLIKDLTSEKILKKETEIKLLQAQINPHFLYNTLDSIYSIATINKVEEISQMVYALSRFFRISLSGGKDTVTLREAYDLAVNYLTIQNIRFKGKIVYESNVPAELMEYKVPKHILQPIVENSVVHGIEGKRDAVGLMISAGLSDGVLQLTVEDHGVGIEETKLLELRNSIEIESFEDSKYFALRNLNRQIKLKYGQDYGLDIDSIFGEGTTVVIRLPAV